MAASKARLDTAQIHPLALDYLEQVRQLHEARPSLYLLLLFGGMLQSPPTGHGNWKCLPAVI